MKINVYGCDRYGYDEGSTMSAPCENPRALGWIAVAFFVATVGRGWGSGSARWPSSRLAAMVTRAVAGRRDGPRLPRAARWWARAMPARDATCVPVSPRGMARRPLVCRAPVSLRGVARRPLVARRLSLSLYRRRGENTPALVTRRLSPFLYRRRGEKMLALS